MSSRELGMLVLKRSRFSGDIGILKDTKLCSFFVALFYLVAPGDPGTSYPPKADIPSGNRFQFLGQCFDQLVVRSTDLTFYVGPRTRMRSIVFRGLPVRRTISNPILFFLTHFFILFN